jgi:hypothetical protein
MKEERVDGCSALSSGRVRKLDSEGGNYRIEIDEPVVILTLWSRPEVDPAEAARWGMEAILRTVSLTAVPGRGVVIDVRQAPAVAGPETARRLEQALTATERRGVRMAALVSDHAMQHLQWTRLMRGHARRHGRVCELEQEALAWAAGKGR